MTQIPLIKTGPTNDEVECVFLYVVLNVPGSTNEYECRIVNVEKFRRSAFFEKLPLISLDWILYRDCSIVLKTYVCNREQSVMIESIAAVASSNVLVF